MEHEPPCETGHWFMVIQKPLYSLRAGAILVTVFLDYEEGPPRYKVSANQITVDPDTGQELPQTVIDAADLPDLLHALSLAHDWINQQAHNSRSVKNRLERFIANGKSAGVLPTDLLTPNIEGVNHD